MILNPFKKFLMLSVLVLGGGGVVAKAQMDAVSRIQANVPFDFTVSETRLPAGKYEIRRLDDEVSNILEMRSANGRITVAFTAEDAQRQDDQIASKTELIFDKVGDQYFLSQVWVAGSASGSELPKSRKQKRLDADGSQAEKHSVVGFMKRLKS
jgi:hypothetical protein